MAHFSWVVKESSLEELCRDLSVGIREISEGLQIPWY